MPSGPRRKRKIPVAGFPFDERRLPWLDNLFSPSDLAKIFEAGGGGQSRHTASELATWATSLNEAFQNANGYHRLMTQTRPGPAERRNVLRSIAEKSESLAAVLGGTALHGLSFDRESWPPAMLELGAIDPAMALDFGAEEGFSCGDPIKDANFQSRLFHLGEKLEGLMPNCIMDSVSSFWVASQKFNPEFAKDAAIRRDAIRRFLIGILPGLLDIVAEAAKLGVSLAETDTPRPSGPSRFWFSEELYSGLAAVYVSMFGNTIAKSSAARADQSDPSNRWLEEIFSICVEKLPVKMDTPDTAAAIEMIRGVACTTTLTRANNLYKAAVRVK